MQVTARRFKKNAHGALQDDNIQKAFSKVKGGFPIARAKAAGELPGSGP